MLTVGIVNLVRFKKKSKYTPEFWISNFRFIHLQTFVTKESKYFYFKIMVDILNNNIYIYKKRAILVTRVILIQLILIFNLKLNKRYGICVKNIDFKIPLTFMRLHSVMWSSIVQHLSLKLKELTLTFPKEFLLQISCHSQLRLTILKGSLIGWISK